MVYAPMHDAAMQDAPMHARWMQLCTMQGALCMHPASSLPTFVCAKCGATVEITNNADPVAIPTGSPPDRRLYRPITHRAWRSRKIAALSIRFMLY